MILTELLPIAGLILFSMGGIMLNILQRTLLKIIGIGLLYLGGSVLLMNVCSFQMSLALFACGIGVCVLLGTVHSEKTQGSEASAASTTWIVFRALLSIVTGILAFTATELLRFWVPVRQTVLFATIWIGIMSLFGMALNRETIHRCLDLQSLCLAFTVFYIYMENSILVFSFFTAINLLLAFGSAYLNMNTQATKAAEDES